MSTEYHWVLWSPKNSPVIVKAYVPIGKSLTMANALGFVRFMGGAYAVLLPPLTPPHIPVESFEAGAALVEQIVAIRQG